MIRIMKLYKSANFAMNQLDEEKLAASKNQVKPLPSEQSKAESASSPDLQESQMYQIQEEDEDESQDNDGINNTKGREAFNEDGE
jgi:alpha-galactosidase